MGNLWVNVLLILTLGVLLWTWDAAGDEYTQGKELFEEKCQICHGADGKGDGPAAAALTPRPRDFTNPQFWQGDVDKKITKMIRNGKAPMPAFQLTESEIQSIIAYLKGAFVKR